MRFCEHKGQIVLSGGKGIPSSATLGGGGGGGGGYTVGADILSSAD